MELIESLVHIELLMMQEMHLFLVLCCMIQKIFISHKLGIVGGSIWHTVGGIRNAPSRGQALQHAWQRAKARAPVLGGKNTLPSIYILHVINIT